MASERPDTIAACTVCGRGYIYINHEGVRCLANDGGVVRLLPEPERGVDDGPADRKRRLQVFARVGSGEDHPDEH